MSDDEDWAMGGGDDEDYDFDYESGDDDGEDNQMTEADPENNYYLAKGVKEDDPEEALKKFREIVTADAAEPSKWGFKALKQSTKILFLELHRPEEALKTYEELLPYTKSTVTKNISEKSINNILEYVAGEGKHGKKAPQVSLETLEAFYQSTLAALREANNERLSVKANLKLARVYLERQEWTKLKSLLKDLHEACAVESTGSGTSAEDQTKASMLLELYATEIQMYSELKDSKKMKAVYEATSKVKLAIAPPRIMGVIKECGGKMWMSERNWQMAYQDFYESFKQFDESGSTQRIQVLKYLVLATMLMGSDINPFEAQETKPYRNHPEIAAMTGLVAAYERRDVHEAEQILKKNRSTILQDSFIRAYIDDVLRSLRTQYLVDLIKPYTRIELGFLAKQLNIEKQDVEGILIELILDGKVKGKIDQQNGRVELERFQNATQERYNTLNVWSGHLAGISRSVTNKSGSRFGGGEADLQAVDLTMMG
ncbi:PCI domain-containing protein [Filobasidium floriforme]|uniref:PCI domain-containing protein n=1 Tax=Filobasidium floriforme TaxID=5210 RepID=UPI001E8CF988|nr:PCI domain-containing protein [Filobasidium floriforme]KAH8088009.1 PCI domain-containing protein [Filobasidium floriforme]